MAGNSIQTIPFLFVMCVCFPFQKNVYCPCACVTKPIGSVKSRLVKIFHGFLEKQGRSKKNDKKKPLTMFREKE